MCWIAPKNLFENFFDKYVTLCIGDLNVVYESKNSMEYFRLFKEDSYDRKWVLCITQESAWWSVWRALECYCDYVHAIVYNKLRSVASREDIEECVCDIFADIFFKYDVNGGFDGDMKGYIGTVAKRTTILKVSAPEWILKPTMIKKRQGLFW